MGDVENDPGDGARNTGNGDSTPPRTAAAAAASIAKPAGLVALIATALTIAALAVLKLAYDIEPTGGLSSLIAIVAVLLTLVGTVIARGRQRGKTP
ncbi:MAG: hypothetical protein QOJ39_3943 [Candidatus Eremiobacteraeota bacterium]|nr:hypothetical protein [Candidatus Eremiobacteraeota bacterium]